MNQEISGKQKIGLIGSLCFAIIGFGAASPVEKFQVVESTKKVEQAKVETEKKIQDIKSKLLMTGVWKATFKWDKKRESYDPTTDQDFDGYLILKEDADGSSTGFFVTHPKKPPGNYVPITGMFGEGAESGSGDLYKFQGEGMDRFSQGTRLTITAVGKGSMSGNWGNGTDQYFEIFGNMTLAKVSELPKAPKDLKGLHLSGNIAWRKGDDLSKRNVNLKVLDTVGDDAYEIQTGGLSEIEAKFGIVYHPDLGVMTGTLDNGRFILAYNSENGWDGSIHFYSSSGGYFNMK